MIEDINIEEIKKAIEHREFDQVLLQSHKQLVLILTQSWCSQWHYMEQWINELLKEDEPDLKNVKIMKYVYDQSPLFSDFLDLKEDQWNNRAIPYLRFYRNGKIITECNYIPKDRFLEILNS
ncbi:MAG: thioredoxin family protein [Spirochaetes bacterium]|nr:thioredoxin family protein [Spirochaetota bacterium]